LRANSIAEFGSPAAVRDLLGQHELKFVALSSGDLLSEPAAAKKSIAEHAAHANALLQIGRRDADHCREIARHERQHARRKKRDQPGEKRS